MSGKASEQSKSEKKGKIKGERKRGDAEAKKGWKDVMTRRTWVPNIFNNFSLLIISRRNPDAGHHQAGEEGQHSQGFHQVQFTFF